MFLSPASSFRISVLLGIFPLPKDGTDRHCRRAWQAEANPSRTAGTSRRTSAGLFAEARPPAASSWCVPNTFPRLQPMSISYIRVMFFRMPALKILRASHRPLKWWQPVDSRLPVRSLMASVPCGHGTDRQKRTEDSHEYTHHRVKGLKFPMGTTVITPSSFTFRLLKSNSNS